MSASPARLPRRGCARPRPAASACGPVVPRSLIARPALQPGPAPRRPGWPAVSPAAPRGIRVGLDAQLLAEERRHLLPLAEVRHFQRKGDQQRLHVGRHGLEDFGEGRELLRAVRGRAGHVGQRHLHGRRLHVVFLVFLTRDGVPARDVDHHLALRRAVVHQDLSLAGQVLFDEIQQCIAYAAAGHPVVVIDLGQRRDALLNKRLDRQAGAGIRVLAHHRRVHASGILDRLLAFLHDLKLLLRQLEVVFDLDLAARRVRICDDERIRTAQLAVGVAHRVVLLVQGVRVDERAAALEQPHHARRPGIDLVLWRQHRPNDSVGHAGQVFAVPEERDIGKRRRLVARSCTRIGPMWNAQRSLSYTASFGCTAPEATRAR